MKKHDFIKPAVMLSLICLCTTLLLAGTNEITKGPIAAQESEALVKRMQAIFPEGDHFDVVTISDTAEAVLLKNDAAVDSVYRASDEGGDTIGYIFIASSTGYAGPVTATVGIRADASIAAVAFLAPDDTPGLGKRVEESAFSDQFQGFSATSEVAVAGASSASSEGGANADDAASSATVTDKIAQNVDAVSGATISSRAAGVGVNKALRAYVYLSENGGLS